METFKKVVCMFEESPDDFIKRVLGNEPIEKRTLKKILNLEKKDLTSLLYITDKIRFHYFQNRIGLCAISNAKSGNCSEDCIFCSQSINSAATIEKYRFIGHREIYRTAQKLSSWPVKRFGIVTSGRTLSKKDIDDFKKSLVNFPETNASCCTSFGIGSYEMMKDLKDAGVKRYHHNLETAESLFSSVCTTHTYEERIETVNNAKKAGLKVCCGGIFGLGETDDQILEFAEAVKETGADSVPVNFLVPVKGTGAEGFNYLTPFKSLLIIAVLRIILHNREIIICGGRKENLRELYPMIFYAGASNLMTGDYLTTSGENFARDLAWIKELGFEPVV